MSAIEILPGSSFKTRKYDSEQEAEAEWLGACLQLPKPALEWAVLKNKMTHEEIANYYTASKEMVRYRINITGINRRYKNYN